MTALPPIRSSGAESFAYFGDREGWLIALSVHRDSDTVERSNWRVIVPAMQHEYPDDTAVECMNHWAVGWIDYLLVRPDSSVAERAQEWAARLAGYPLADEEDYSELEYAEEWCVRCDRGIREDHYADRTGVCRKFRSAEDASDIAYRWESRPRWYVGAHIVGSITCLCGDITAHTPSITYPAP